MRTVLVTGAAGTVGHSVVALAEALGYRVIASDRWAQGVRVPLRGEVRAGDLRDRSFVEGLVRGVDAVIHTAAILDEEAPEEVLWAVNTESVAWLYQAASRAGVRRFVHVSTAMIYATGQKGAITEEGSIAPRGIHGQTKLEAERILQSQRGRGAPWTIVRAAPIYGRRGRHFAAILLAIGPALRLFTPLLPRPHGGPLHCFVHAEDVARALIHLLEKEEAAWGIFNVAEENPLSIGDRLAITFDAYGLATFPCGPLPRLWLHALSRAGQKAWGHRAIDALLVSAYHLVVMRHGLKPALRARIGKEALTLLVDDLVLDTSRLRATGWKARFPRFADGWRDVLRWYQAEGWAPRYT
ncbi:MAG: NAD(P)-dependent oxidoreductase [Deltaproteobacteria bacterium]|nr:NAD(P)-dependent oxidoreductase [Sandaracinaceae bacterium]MCX7807192.1 NAD(P)-dependent oxidoreductase [Deltaproteobacteria bacterium]MDW8245887.1 NAD(P)-dependent oxidoreductase [Sandaracinaceae bacterium]